MTLDQARALIFPQAQQFVAAPLALKPLQAKRVREMSVLKWGTGDG